MKTRICKTVVETVAATVAPEDLRCGDFVAVLQEVVEIPSFLFGGCGGDQPAITRLTSVPGKPTPPLCVEAICLPYVFVTHPRHRHRTLDVRQCQLARIHPDYARTVWRLSRPKGE